MDPLVILGQGSKIFNPKNKFKVSISIYPKTWIVLNFLKYLLLAKPKVGVVFDEEMLLHRNHREHHPERPERAMAIYLNLIKKGYLFQGKLFLFRIYKELR